MNSDAAFTVGKTHRVCQDYARTGKSGEYVIVADGCSGSEDSDFGSRLLVKSVENAIIDPSTADPMEELRFADPAIPLTSRAIVNAKAAAKVLKLNEVALDATLIISQYRETTISTEQTAKAIHVTIWGDGVVVGRRRADGVLEAHNVSFPSGFPQYLSYRLDEKRRARLNNHTNGNKAHIEAWTIEKDKATCESAKDDDDEYRLFIFPVDKYDVVATFSDGVTSFQTDKVVEVPWYNVVRDLLDVSPMKGEFVQRALNWVVKEYTKRKWIWADDVSMGAISLD